MGRWAGLWPQRDRSVVVLLDGRLESSLSPGLSAACCAPLPHQLIGRYLRGRMVCILEVRTRWLELPAHGRALRRISGRPPPQHLGTQQRTHTI